MLLSVIYLLFNSALIIYLRRDDTQVIAEQYLFAF